MAHLTYTLLLPWPTYPFHSLTSLHFASAIHSTCSDAAPSNSAPAAVFIGAAEGTETGAVGKEEEEDNKDNINEDNEDDEMEKPLGVDVRKDEKKPQPDEAGADDKGDADDKEDGDDKEEGKEEEDGKQELGEETDADGKGE